jgi:hypothetical protein
MQITTTIIHANKIGVPDCIKCELEPPSQWTTYTGVMKGIMTQEVQSTLRIKMEQNLISVSKEATVCSSYRFPACSNPTSRFACLVQSLNPQVQTRCRHVGEK